MVDPMILGGIDSNLFELAFKDKAFIEAHAPMLCALPSCALGSFKAKSF